MAIKVYGAWYSSASNRVLTLLEKEVAFELIPVDGLTGGHKQPQNLALRVRSPRQARIRYDLAFNGVAGLHFKCFAMKVERHIRVKLSCSSRYTVTFRSKLYVIFEEFTAMNKQGH